MSAYAITTGVLFGVIPHFNLGQSAGNRSAVMESAAPTSILNYSTTNVFGSSIAGDASLESGAITMQVVVDIVQSGDMTATEVPLVDSIPPRITIDTVRRSVRPQETTQAEPETTMGSPAAGGRSDASYPTTGAHLDQEYLGENMGVFRLR
ncbi:hypothetical protein F5Y13DRAFT_160654 [Hypoxylon sp. FL1857]|nr:hypothetical protein F5Y13DRAFT_160654 [Hypoxylon sp. FL1857]